MQSTPIVESEHALPNKFKDLCNNIRDKIQGIKDNDSGKVDAAGRVPSISAAEAADANNGVEGGNETTQEGDDDAIITDLVN